MAPAISNRPSDRYARGRRARTPGAGNRTLRSRNLDQKDRCRKPKPARILQYAYRMSSTTRITVTLPSDQVAELRKLTDNVSGYVAEAVARQIRHQLLGEDLRRHEEEHGPFSNEELAEARGKIFGPASTSKGADAA